MSGFFRSGLPKLALWCYIFGSWLNFLSLSNHLLCYQCDLQRYFYHFQTLRFDWVAAKFKIWIHGKYIQKVAVSCRTVICWLMFLHPSYLLSLNQLLGMWNSIHVKTHNQTTNMSILNIGYQILMFGTLNDDFTCK